MIKFKKHLNISWAPHKLWLYIGSTQNIFLGLLFHSSLSWTQPLPLNWSPHCHSCEGFACLRLQSWAISQDPNLSPSIMHLPIRYLTLKMSKPNLLFYPQHCCSYIWHQVGPLPQHFPNCVPGILISQKVRLKKRFMVN